MRAGDTFRLVGSDVHLWMILSDPEIDPARVLLVNFTTWRSYHDQACVLEGGEHPFVHHRTCVNYRDARLHSMAQLEALQQDGLIEPHERLTSELLRLIRNRAGDSHLIALEHYQLLEDQGLIEFDD
jgi:hypothetical protein